MCTRTLASYHKRRFCYGIWKLLLPHNSEIPMFMGSVLGYVACATGQTVASLNASNFKLNSDTVLVMFNINYPLHR
jgi:hypothetical protein